MVLRLSCCHVLLLFSSPGLQHSSFNGLWSEKRGAYKLQLFAGIIYGTTTDESDICWEDWPLCFTVVWRIWEYIS